MMMEIKENLENVQASAQTLNEALALCDSKDLDDKEILQAFVLIDNLNESPTESPELPKKKTIKLKPNLDFKN